MSKPLSKKLHVTSVEKSTWEISEEDLQLVTGGSGGVAPGGVPIPHGDHFVPSRNNPTAGTIYDKNSKPVNIIIGDCNAGPC